MKVTEAPFSLTLYLPSGTLTVALVGVPAGTNPLPWNLIAEFLGDACAKARAEAIAARQDVA